MRIPNSRTRSEMQSDRSMTAMIDLVFLLLIFFMCASIGQVGEMLVPTTMSAGAVESKQFQQQEKPFGEVWIFLRRGDNGETDDGETVVQVNEGGSLYRKDEQGTFRRVSDQRPLAEVLQGLSETTDSSIPVILDIRRSVPMGDVMKIRVAVMTARFHNVKFATEPGD